jgi:hypothetical protein
MSWRIAPLVLVLLLLPLPACQLFSRSPESTMRKFFEVCEGSMNREIYEMLAPSTQTQLAKLAAMATAQTGGRRKLRPEDMLFTSTEAPPHPVTEISALHVKDDHAQVKVTSTADYHETFNLIRVGRQWRIILPQKRPQ